MVRALGSVAAVAAAALAILIGVLAFSAHQNSSPARPVPPGATTAAAHGALPGPAAFLGPFAVLFGVPANQPPPESSPTPSGQVQVQVQSTAANGGSVTATPPAREQNTCGLVASLLALVGGLLGGGSSC